MLKTLVRFLYRCALIFVTLSFSDTITEETLWLSNIIKNVGISKGFRSSYVLTSVAGMYCKCPGSTLDIPFGMSRLNFSEQVY